jgi:ribosomal protein S18 acetylase RimI-like enzyme
MWHVAGHEERSPLVDFLLREEWRCVSLSSRLREESPLAHGVAEAGATLVLTHKGTQHAEVGAALMLTRTGVALPVFDGLAAFEMAPGERTTLLFERFLSRIHSVMGMKPCVLTFEAAVAKQPYASVDYHMMVRDLRGWAPSPETAPRTVSVRKAFPEDTDAIFPLQKSYELEEVYLDPRTFDDRRCRSLLRRGLREEAIYVVEMAGVPVAKAATNARGFTTDQIGGVFTRRDLRHRGLARVAMEALMQHIARDKTHACLFVKKPNLPAIRLYMGLGFSIRGEYRISYFNRV